MHDIFPDSPKFNVNPLERFHLKRMILSPSQWKGYQPLGKLNWLPVKFDPKNINQIPDDQSGVYSFVVKPGIANHDNLAYLVYVGKAERQTFRARYQQYLAEFRKGDESRWLHVAEMLNRWHEFLWFYYAEVPKNSTITPLEKNLISAFLPPCNHSFHGDCLAKWGDTR